MARRHGDGGGVWRVGLRGEGLERCGHHVSMAQVPVFRGEATGGCGGGGGQGEGGVQHQWAGADRARGRGCHVACSGSGVEALLQLPGSLRSRRLYSAAQGTVSLRASSIAGESVARFFLWQLVGI